MMKLGKGCKKHGFLIGIVLGFGAPAGSLLVRAFLKGTFNHEWVSAEVSRHSFFYSYMILTTPIVFSVFGYIMGFLLDKLSAQKRSLEAVNVVLEGQSVTDDMTGLYNHRHLIDVMGKELERAKRYHRTLSTIMLDIDGFKKINDQYGHLIGDRVLKELAYVLKKTVRQIDTVGRYGGDEFFVLLPESTINTARIVAGRIQNGVRAFRFNQLGNPLSITVSVGISSFEDSRYVDQTQLIERTDRALLKAKSLGMNECVVNVA